MKKMLKRHKGKVFNWLMLEATLWAAVKLLNFSFLESNWKLSHKKSFHLSLPCPPQYFVTHVDVTTQDGLVVRLSFSNLFKEFKSTSTWLQFPFVCPAGKGSVERITSKSVRKGMIISFRVLKKKAYCFVHLYVSKCLQITKSIICDVRFALVTILWVLSICQKYPAVLIILPKWPFRTSKGKMKKFLNFEI